MDIGGVRMTTFFARQVGEVPQSVCRILAVTAILEFDDNSATYVEKCDQSEEKGLIRELITLVRNVRKPSKENVFQERSPQAPSAVAVASASPFVGRCRGKGGRGDPFCRSLSGG